ncbi:MAG: hypothetical protein JO235_12795 [Chroococcidiopsidaceae cyanobacterium CP_BM_RX_35]|nr:hypothetical protein [Chroococcidiopsidaceae cyanobacterium CP_BM_RX_35]
MGRIVRVIRHVLKSKRILNQYFYAFDLESGANDYARVGQPISLSSRSPLSMSIKLSLIKDNQIIVDVSR